MSGKETNIIWKLLLLGFIINLQNCLALPDVEVFNDNSLDELNDLYKKWLTYLSKVPDASWMVHGSSNPKLNWHNYHQHQGNRYRIPTVIDDTNDEVFPTGSFDDKLKRIIQKLEKVRNHLLSEFNISDIDDEFPTIIPPETEEISSTQKIVSRFSYTSTTMTVPSNPTVSTDHYTQRSSTSSPRLTDTPNPTTSTIPSNSSVAKHDLNKTIDALVELIDNIVNDLSKLNFSKFENDLSKFNLTNFENIISKLNITLIDNIITKLNETIIDDILGSLNSTIIAKILLEINSTLSKIDVAAIQELLNKFNFEEFLEKELLKKNKSTHNRCSHDLNYLMYLMFKPNKKRAIEILDAAGKLPSGLLRGSIHWTGDFRQCRSIGIPEETIGNTKFGNFKGEYCYISWNVKFNQVTQPLYMGICVPDSCTSKTLLNETKEMTKFLNYIPVVKKINNYANLTEITCQSNERHWEPSHIVYLCILVIFAFFIFLGTLYDILKTHLNEIKADNENGNSDIENNRLSNANSIKYGTESASAIAIGKVNSVNSENKPLSIQETYSENQESFFIQFLMCFSVYTNGAKVFNVGNSGAQLNCLHGIRFFSMSWIILGHTYIYAVMSVGNIVDVLEDINSFSFQIISQATFSVDTFFLISGFLLSYLFLKERFEKQTNMNWIYYYVHRIWRLTPAFAMLLGFYSTLWLHLGSGPSWPNETDNGNCKRSWWWNIFYILNFEDSNDMCMGWTWYLANDMQFYIISPIFLLLLWKLPIIGTIVVGIVILISWIVTGVLSIEYDLGSVLTFNQNMKVDQVTDMQAKKDQYFDIIYDKPYCRIGPYMVGILTGYLLLVAFNHRKFMRSAFLVIGWIFALFFGLSVIFGLYNVDIGMSTGAVYNAVARTTWSVAVAWVLFVCLIGYGGPVNTILSWKIWIPFSRLTYCAYLVHPMIIQWYYNSLLKPLHFETNTMVVFYFGFLVFAYLVAFIASMALESPMMALEKLLLQKSKKRRDKP